MQTVSPSLRSICLCTISARGGRKPNVDASGDTGRLSARMEEVAKRITYEDEGLTRLLKEAIREAGLKRFDGKEGESMNGWRGCKGNMSPLRRRPCFRSGGSQQFFSQSQVVRKLRYELPEESPSHRLVSLGGHCQVNRLPRIQSHPIEYSDVVLLTISALLHKSLRHVRLSPMGQGASMRNDAESIHVPVPSTQLVRLQSGADRQGASDLLVR